MEAIRSLIDAGKYFAINRARQYGKTTTVAMLKNKLDKEYVFFSISFEGIGEKAYSSEERFCRFFMDFYTMLCIMEKHWVYLMK